MQPMRNASNLWKIHCTSEDALCFRLDVVHGMAIDFLVEEPSIQGWYLCAESFFLLAQSNHQVCVGVAVTVH